MDRINKSYRIKVIALLLSFLSFHYSAAVKADFPAVILDHTATDIKWSILSDLYTLNSVCINRYVIIDKFCNGISFRKNRGDIQVIKNNERNELTNYVGVRHPETVSSGHAYTDDNPLNLKPATNKHLFDLDRYRDAANAISISISSPSLADGETPYYGSISFSDFIKNVAVGKTMYGIVRVKIPLTNSSGAYKFCGESDCLHPVTHTAICGPTHGNALEYSTTVCGESITTNSHITVYGSLMLDFVDAATGSPISFSALDEPHETWYKIAVPININPAHPNSVRDNTLTTLYTVRAIAGSNDCGGDSSCTSATTRSARWSDVNDIQESIDMYLYKMGESLEGNFNDLSDDQKFHLLLPSGYEKGWAEAFSTLNISNATWGKGGYGFSVSPYSESVTVISEVDVRSEHFEDIPALISTGGVLSINYHTNISGLVYAPGAFELIQANKGIPPLQYFNGAIITYQGFYLDAQYDDDSITVISNNPDVYSKIELSQSSPAYGKVTKVTGQALSKIGPSRITALDAELDANGNLPAVDIFGQPTNFNSPGRQWIEITP